MKRNYSFRTDKFSLFLFGVSAGLLSMVPVTHAQQQLSSFAEAAPVIRSPRELMAATNWRDKMAAKADASTQAVPPRKTLLPMIVTPAFAKRFKVLQNGSIVPSTQQNAANSIQVDSTAFSLDSKNQTEASFVNEPETRQQRALKFPVNWNRLQPVKQASKAKPRMPMVVSHSKVTTGELAETTDGQIATQQTAATSEALEATISKANLAFLRKPMNIIDPTTLNVNDPDSKPSRIRPASLLQPINASTSVAETATAEVEQGSLRNVTTYGLHTPIPTGPISLFVDGPDYLSINQVGEYEIAVANSSADAALASRISLQVPPGVEIIGVQREAEVDEPNRTLTWNINRIASGKQQRFRFRVKMTAAGKVDFPVTISQDGRESQTVSQETFVR